jgi:hypothetical protein
MSNIITLFRVLFFLSITFALGIGFTVLPRELALPSFMIFSLLIFIAIKWKRHIIIMLAGLNRFVSMTKLHQPSNLVTYKFSSLHLLEIIVILLMSVFVTRHQLNFTPDMRVRGKEVEWLTGIGQVAHQGLEDTGTIPLWNPYYRQGEPLVDNAFSYILNPFSSIPQLLFASTQGTKISITIHALVVAIGGWFLGWVLGLSTSGRLTLAFLLLGKGNMHANFEAGYYQLATQQAYFPWVMAGTIAFIRSTHRWAIVLTVLSLMLMLFAGNLWHLLPTVISIGVLIILHSNSLDVLKRAISVMLLTLGLCAVLLLSIIANFGFIEEHPDEIRAGWEMIDPNRAYLLPFDSAPDNLSYLMHVRHDETQTTLTTLMQGQNSHFYYSYVSPWWFVVLILLPLPFMRRFRQNLPQNRMIWIAGVGLFVLFTLWAMGGTSLFVWLYEHVPYLAQWRFVPRALGMASFWVAVLIAMRIDALMRLLLHYSAHARWMRGLLIFYVMITIGAWVDVNSKWDTDPLLYLDSGFNSCLSWLHETHLDENISLRVYGYERMTYLLEHDIRMINIEADYMPSTATNTIGDSRLDARLRDSRFRFQNRPNQRDIFTNDDYIPMTDSPPYRQFEHCLFENEAYDLPYAFTFNLADTQELVFGEEVRNPTLTNEYVANLNVTAVPDYTRLYDTVKLLAQSDTQTQQVLVIQELAYPGWEVWIDGERQPIEIFAKLNAAKLPTDGQLHEVVFMYRPPLFIVGSIITILTALFCAGYLLRLDRFYRK